jgi:hypothetical protein
MLIRVMIITPFASIAHQNAPDVNKEPQMKKAKQGNIHHACRVG